MWSTNAACMLCVIIGLLCDVKPVCSQPRLIHRKTTPPPSEGTQLEQDIQKIITGIHSLSASNTRSLNEPVVTAAEGVDLNAYFAVFNKLYSIIQPLLKEKFLDDFPKMLVCILSEKQDCGLQAELIRTVSLELGKPLLLVLSSVRSQTCASLPTDEESSSFFRKYLGTGDSTSAGPSGFQQMALNILSSLSLSDNVMNVVNSFTDSAVTYTLKFLAILLQAPLDYVKIALEFGIKVPYLNEGETCQQGDLKQLIMWGLKHNMSWSFGAPLFDIVLEILLPQEESPYTHLGSECQKPPGSHLQRSVSETTDDHDSDHQLRCENHDMAKFNDTICANIISGSGGGSSMSVFTLCEALSSLSPQQIEKVWSNTCRSIQQVVPPLVSRSSDCSLQTPSSPPPPIAAPSPPPPALPPPPHRVAREAFNLQQLACNYNGWMEAEAVDAVHVSLCSDNERDEFVNRVCNNESLMKKLLLDTTNGWLYGYCANSSADLGYMVSRFCAYEQWLDRVGASVDSLLLEFCLSLDGPRLTQLVCQHTGFLMLLISNPENWPLMPNCTNMGPPPPLLAPDLQLESCQYHEWQNLMQITTDQLSKCIQLDQGGFNKEVCANKTFLNALLQNPEISWLEHHCHTSFSFQHTETTTATPTPIFNNTNWCDYHTWAGRHVDDSVVALCWKQDQLAFQEKVCCKASVFEKLIENPQNEWLSLACSDIKEIMVPPQACRYSEWSSPVIVDMTELALCAEIDPHNFTSKVCANETILQNLLANQDNTWLIQHCANYSNSGVSPSEGGGEPGGGPTGFDPTDQCQYSTWRISPPDASLLTLCWEQDQSNFISSICPNHGLLSSLSREPSSMWVGSMCITYTNYTTTTTTSGNNGTTEPTVCQAKSLVDQFNWNCSAFFTSACQPCATQNMVLQTVARCWVESLRSRVEELLTPAVTAVLEQAVSTGVVVLLTLEDFQSSSWHVTETLRQSVLKSVVEYLKGEKNSDKKTVLLQCFGTALTNLMLTARDMTSDELILIKEYFDLPLSSVKLVLGAAHIRTVRLILQYYSSNHDKLQLSDAYLSNMVSVLLQTHLVTDEKLFPELAPLLARASPSDIQVFPSLQRNPSVVETINENLAIMTLDLRQAFGSWYSRVASPSDIIRGHQSLIRDTGNLIAYLPFQHFQHFSPAQLLEGLDVLQRNTLTPLKKEFIARTIISSYKNLTAEDFTRLADISCLAEPDDLLVYRSTGAFRVIQDNIINCARRGLSLPSQLVSNMLLSSPDLQTPSSLTTERLADLVPLMPLLGVTFLQGLTASQLHHVLPKINSTSFTPEQASLIVDKLSSSNRLTPGQLSELGSLAVGVKTESLLTLSSDRLRTSLSVLAQHAQDVCSPRGDGLQPPQANAIVTKLWGFPAVVHWLNDVNASLSCTPLLSVLSRTHLLVNKTLNTTTKSWNTQQARAIFNEMLETSPNQINQDFLSLGSLGQGLSCDVLQAYIRSDPSPSSARSALAFLRRQPHLLHTSLKKCLILELKNHEFFSSLLEDLGAEIALSMPVSLIKRFPVLDPLRRMILEEPQHFLLQSRMKQNLLVDKIMQKLDMYTGVFTEEEFRSLGFMASFAMDEVFVQVDRRFFIENLDLLRTLCYSRAKMEVVARILEEPAVFGSIKDWNQTTLSQVDRFLFFLPRNKLDKISPALMTVGRIEKLFMSQRQWERGDVGKFCSEDDERRYLFESQQFVLQFYLGFLKIYPNSAPPMNPTCEILHTTFPSAWTSSSLYNMATSAFSNCLELIGRDPFLAPHQRSKVLQRVKEIHGPVSSFSQSVISQLGGVAAEMSLEELSRLRLTERRSIAAMGTLSIWNNRQLDTLFAAVLKSTKKTPSQLDSSTLVAMGHIVCGANTTEIKSFNPVEFGKAVLWLGRLRLSCSEEQLTALVQLLAHVFAFGSMSSWGTGVFIEIGVLAAGLPDMAMSALVKEQIEGITPLAVSTISPAKFSVVFDQRHINMLSYEQAAAVTSQQIDALTEVERMALAIVLTPWEDKNVNFRGRSMGLALSHSPLCLTLGLLMLLAVLICPGTLPH